MLCLTHTLHGLVTVLGVFKALLRLATGLKSFPSFHLFFWSFSRPWSQPFPFQGLDQAFYFIFIFWSFSRPWSQPFPFQGLDQAFLFYFYFFGPFPGLGPSPSLFQGLDQASLFYFYFFGPFPGPGPSPSPFQGLDQAFSFFFICQLAYHFYVARRV